MTLQSEYFDPVTGIIHIYQLDNSGVIAAGSTEGSELGLEDTAFNDVKVKLLSVDYNASGYVYQTAGYEAQAFTAAEQAAGSVLMGIMNKGETVNNFTGLSSFVGTSAWPAAVKSFHTVCGTKFSVSHRWKPKKTGLSNEQNAFITVRNDTASSGDLYVWRSIYIRMVRL